MANQEHLAILEQGIETWNAWRKQHVDVEPDLSDADSRGWNLRGYYFSGANLSGADLREADLREAEFGWVGLDLDYQHAAANLLSGCIRANSAHPSACVTTFHHASTQRRGCYRRFLTRIPGWLNRSIMRRLRILMGWLDDMSKEVS